MPMLNDDEGFHDWEMKDEEPPEQLQKKWEQEEARCPQTAVCPSCKKETPVGNLTCIFCGTGLYFKKESDQPWFSSIKKLMGNQDSPSRHNEMEKRLGQCRPNCHNGNEMKNLDGALLSQASCPVHGFLKWVKRLFKKD